MAASSTTRFLYTPDQDPMAHLELAALIVREYDPAIDFFVRILGFELVEDSPSLTNDGRPKRWVVVRPPGAVTGILLARADGEQQEAAIGRIPSQRLKLATKQCLPLSRGLTLAACGVAVGIVLGVGLMRLLRSLLYEAPTIEPRSSAFGTGLVKSINPA